MARNRSGGGHGTIYGGGALPGSPAVRAGTNQGGGGGRAGSNVYTSGGGGSGSGHSGGGNRGGGGGNGGAPNFGTWGQGGQLSLFSNTNERNAAKVLQSAYGQAYTGAQNKLEGGWEGLKNQYGNAMDTLAAGATTARGDVTYGRDAGIGALYGGQNAGVGALTQGRDAALAGFSPYAATGQAANQMYGNATGLGGAAGNQAAVNAFQTGPGYNFAMEQGLTGIDRRAASRGMLGSGNTAQDSIAYSQGLANQEYGQWLDRLAGQQAMGVHVAGQTGQINTGTGANLANLYSTTGNQVAGAYTGAGAQLAGIAQDTAQNTAGIYTDLGNQRYQYGSDLAGLKYGSVLGQGTAQANYLAGTDKLGANVVNLGLGGASTAASILNPYGQQQGQSSNNLWG